MEMIKVTFPDGSVHEFEKGVKILDVAISISEGFARNVIGAVVNDDVIKGLSETLKEDCTVKFVKFEDKEGKEIFWHTSSHVMALAIQRLFPDTKFGIGPAIENGFYYDLDSEHKFTPEDLEKIEEDQTNYSRYLKSLREEESIAREKLIYINQEKEVIKRKLDNSRVPGFSDRFIVLYKDVTDSYRYAIEELKKEPINIDLLKRAVAEAEESLDIYASEVNNILTDIELIEKLIRYANRYRKDNVEFHQQLTVAEQYYREYRYNKTLEIIRNSLDKVEPGAYERIRNSVKPR